MVALSAKIVTSVRRLPKERYSELKSFIEKCSIADEKKILLKIKQYDWCAQEKTAFRR